MVTEHSLFFQTGDESSNKHKVMVKAEHDRALDELSEGAMTISKL